MSRLSTLTELSRLATAEEDTAKAVASALDIVARETGADHVYIVYGTEDDFKILSGGAQLEISRTGLWVTHRALTSADSAIAFSLRLGRVTEFGPPSHRAFEYVAALLPTALASADFVVLKGSWQRGMSAGQREYLAVAVPLLSLLLLRRLKIVRAEGDRTELATLFSVGRIVSGGEELPAMLARFAASVASLVGVNYAVIDMLGPDGSVRLRCLNQDIPRVTSWAERWTRAAQRPDPVRNIVLASRQPMVFEDAQNDERLPERSREFFSSTLIRSTAVFPLIANDQAVGVLSMGSAWPTRFDGRQRDVIDDVAAQIAAAIYAIRLFEDRAAAEAALRVNQELLTATIESTADGILAVDAEGHVSYANRRFAEMWRVPPELMARGNDGELIEFAMQQLADPEAWRAGVRALYASVEDDFGTLTFRDGRVFERFSRALVRDGQPAGRVWSFRDVTERHRTEQLLIEQAQRDSLTKLYNHAAIEEKLREAAASADRVGIAVIDVDGMKAVNDTYGHIAGDDALVAVAHALEHDGAHVGRYGGDEFVVVLPTMDRARAERYCRDTVSRLARADVRDPLTGSRLPISVSMGLTVWPSETRIVDDCIRVADEAMYSEKRERMLDGGAGAARSALAEENASRMIGELVPLLTSSARLDVKLDLVAQHIADGAGYAAVRFLFDATDTTSALAVARFAPVTAPTTSVLSSEITALVRRTRRPVFVDDLSSDDRILPKHREAARKAGLGPGLCVPLVSDDTVVGFLSVASVHGAVLDARDARFLSSVAEQVMAIARMETLVDDLEASTTRLQEARVDTVVMLAAAAEAHDATTGRHLNRVRTISELLARQLGYTEDDVSAIGLAAILHDIGKIRVPESILVSPARLNGQEWSLMKRHTEWGAEFLSQRPGFELAAAIARHHHERWDGTGYPEGLCREEIPPEAAIVAVADSLDAITNDRPYRAGRSLQWAIGEIMDCAGRQFSPRVVECLVKVYRTGGLRFLQADEVQERAA